MYLYNLQRILASTANGLRSLPNVDAALRIACGPRIATEIRYQYRANFYFCGGITSRTPLVGDVDNGEVIACMDVWLQTEEAAKRESFGFRFVFRPQQATPMSQNNAREAMHEAKRDHPDYVWEWNLGSVAANL